MVRPYIDLFAIKNSPNTPLLKVSIPEQILYQVKDDPALGPDLCIEGIRMINKSPCLFIKHRKIERI